MKLGRAEADAIFKAVSKGALSILEARCNLGDNDITVSEVGVTVGHIPKRLGLFKSKPAVFADSLHWHEGYRRILVYPSNLGLHRVNLHLEA